MSAPKTLRSSGEALRRTLLLWWFPQLAKVSSSQWNKVLHQACEVDFDGFERVGLVASVAFTAYMLDSPAPDGAPLSTFIHYVIVFLQALALLAVVAGPLYLRRTKRGLANILSANRQAMARESRNDPDNR